MNWKASIGSKPIPNDKSFGILNYEANKIYKFVQVINCVVYQIVSFVIMQEV